MDLGCKIAEALGLDPKAVSRFVLDCDASTGLFTITVHSPRMPTDAAEDIAYAIKQFLLKGGYKEVDDAVS